MLLPQAENIPPLIVFVRRAQRGMLAAEIWIQVQPLFTRRQEQKPSIE